ncbi:hypothetical protein RCCWILLIS_90 [Rhodobacter phage RcCWillis]|nr:hypothetical protein RCCWILLIS_90 [Rhodobacter phage RcCWillis]
MGLSLEAHKLHRAYDNLDDLARSDADLPGRLKSATDEAFDRVAETIEEAGFKYSRDDLAEALVARIFEFICKSNDLDPANFAPFD